MVFFWITCLGFWKKKEGKKISSFSSAHFSLLFFSSLRFGDILLRRRKEICVRERESAHVRARAQRRKRLSFRVVVVVVVVVVV